MSNRIGIVGSNSSISNESQIKFAFSLGKSLVDHGYDIINGGMGGIMEASARGAKESQHYDRGSVIGFLPAINKELGNQYSGIQIITDIGSARNRFIILNSDAIIAIGGGAGTLNEISLAWELRKPIAAFVEGGGWSGELAGRKIDNRHDSEIFPISTVEDCIQWLNSIF